jgi:hypothetical protein
MAMADKEHDEKGREGQSSEKSTAVAKLLAEAEGARVSAVLFLDGSIPAGDIEKRVHHLIDEAEQAKVESSGPAKIRQVNKYAKSVALEADRGVLEAICRSADVKTVLPSEVEDIHPRPVGKSGGKERPARGTRGKTSRH